MSSREVLKYGSLMLVKSISVDLIHLNLALSLK